MENRASIVGRQMTIAEAVLELQAGRMVLICDDEGRENEADLCLAAQFATPQAINFLIHSACGLLCVALTGERLDALRIPLAKRKGDPLQGTAFTTSVDALHGVTTGISASERAVTIRTLIDPTTRPEDIVCPGHVFPLRACPGGTLERRGHTEAAVDLMRIAGLEPGAVICEVLSDDGEAARGETLLALARRWGLGLLSVDMLAHYRQDHAVSLISETQLPTPDATFRLLHYREIETNRDYLALLLGDLQAQQEQPPLLRLHSACMTGDIFGSQRCDCQAQMHAALQAIAAEGRGVLLYLPQEGRGIGLAGKLQAYRLQEQGCDTVEANEQLGYPIDARTYTPAIEILRDLDITSARLMTNSPTKILALREGGITVERVPLEIPPTSSNLHYLQAKQQRLGHFLIALSEPHQAIPLSTKGEDFLDATNHRTATSRA
ncbi:MAG: bifunctional 3,4-dihydroxy-2-butanone-4-phosphate synthase/GTP cyclohydrolase II [Ktedonobacteraceae bacterium]